MRRPALATTHLASDSTPIVRRSAGLHWASDRYSEQALAHCGVSEAHPTSCQLASSRQMRGLGVRLRLRLSERSKPANHRLLQSSMVIVATPPASSRGL